VPTPGPAAIAGVDRLPFMHVDQPVPMAVYARMDDRLGVVDAGANIVFDPLPLMPWQLHRKATQESPLARYPDGQVAPLIFGMA
jgi:hypothetical protein